MNQQDSIKFLLGHMEEATQRPRSEIGVYLLPLYALALQSKGAVVELGVGSGFSTAALFLGAADAGNTLNSYDVQMTGEPLPGGGRLGTVFQRLRTHPKASSWRFNHMKGKEGAADFEDSSVGLLFIDSSHEYEGTMDEFAAWLPKMRPDGIICGHDYYLHLPRAAYRHPTWQHTGEKSPDPSSGVFRAANEFAELHKDRFDFLAIGPYDFGFFVLWPRRSA